MTTKAEGALCTNCPLEECSFVPPEVNNEARLFVLGESPGKTEVDLGRPFVGPSGRLLEQAFSTFGVVRTSVHVSNAVLCRPPAGLDPKAWKEAIRCCRPRLQKELENTKPKTILSLGGKALQSLTDKAKITPWRGAPIKLGPVGTKRDGVDFSGYTVLPALHPAAILRDQKMYGVLLSDVAKAVMLSRGELPEWKWPEFILEDGDKVRTLMHKWLRSGASVGVDVETGGIDPESSRLLCVGVASTTEGFSIDWPVQPETLPLLKDLMASDQVKKSMQNGQHDCISLYTNGFTVNGYDFDTLLAHHVIAPRLPHDLGFIASMEFPAPRWKTMFGEEGDRKGAEKFIKADPTRLRLYNIQDAYMTEMLRKPLMDRLQKVPRGMELYNEAFSLYRLSEKMRLHGVCIDQKVREEYRTKFRAKQEMALNRVRKVTGEPEFNPNAIKQIRDWLTSRNAKSGKRSDKTGLPSYDAETLKKLLGDGTTEVREFCRELLLYRNWTKLLRTYVDGLPVASDGRIHPVWKSFGTRTGRWSSTKPNTQNLPKGDIRKLFVASPGKVLVEADWSQLELRVSALLSGDDYLLEGYARGADMHTENARTLLGVEKVDKGERALAKKLGYALCYGASPSKIFRSVVEEFPAFTELHARQMHRRWFNRHLKMKKWQDTLLARARKDGFVEERLSGRRQYYQGDVDPNEVLNFPIQGFAGSLCNRAILRLDKQLNWQNEAILLQVHDAIVVEGSDQQLLTELLRSAMEVTIELDGGKMSFPVDLQVGPNWGSMNDVK